MPLREIGLIPVVCILRMKTGPTLPGFYGRLAAKQLTHANRVRMMGKKHVMIELSTPGPGLLGTAGSCGTSWIFPAAHRFMLSRAEARVIQPSCAQRRDLHGLRFKPER